MGIEYSIGNSCLVYYPPYSCTFILDPLPEIIIDNSLVQYSGLNSTAVLQDYMSSAVSVNQLPAYTEKLGSALGGLLPIPNAVGLGALVISIILELILGTNDQVTTGDILRRVFAEEKASEIRDLMDEYMRRLTLNLRSPRLQLEDTRRIEAMLSVQLTRLKNSMLTDGHMSPRALSHWVNGAAFHAQMLIHQARLEDGDGSRATAALDLYQRDLNLLNDNYRTYVPNLDALCLRKHVPKLECNMELEGPKQYFSSVKQDIQALIKQHNTFKAVLNS